MIGTVPFALSLDLKQVASIQFLKDFTFKVGDRRYQMPKMLAAFLSPYAARILKADFMADTFEVQIDDPEGDFQLIVDLLTGVRQDVPAVKLPFLSKAGAALGNKQLLHCCGSVELEEYTTENAISAALAIEQTDEELPNALISFIAKKVPELEVDKLRTLSCRTLQRVFDSEDLVIANEQWLLGFINDLIAAGKEEVEILIPCIDFKKLPQADRSCLVEFAEKGLMVGETVVTVCRMLAGDDSELEPKRKRTYLRDDLVFKYEGPDSWNGVFGHFDQLSALSSLVAFKRQNGSMLHVSFEENMLRIVGTPNDVYVEFSAHDIQLRGMVIRYSINGSGWLRNVELYGVEGGGNEVSLLMSSWDHPWEGRSKHIESSATQSFKKFHLSLRWIEGGSGFGGFSFGGGGNASKTVKFEFFGVLKDAI